MYIIEGKVKGSFRKSFRWLKQRYTQVHDGNGIFRKEEWSNLRVGNIVRVEKDEFFSGGSFASLIELRGFDLLETMNIDGETNLKVKQGLEATSSLLHEDFDFKDFKALVRCKGPNVNLYMFVGTLALKEERSIARDSFGDPVLQQRIIQEDNVSKTMNPIELIQSRPRAFILLIGLTHGLIRRDQGCAF